MQVSLKTEAVKSSADEMKQMRRKLNACKLELEQITRELAALSEVDEARKRLRRCEEEIEEQAGYCMLFDSTLNQICHLYDKNENRLIDYSENVKRRAAREAVGPVSLSGFYSILEKVVCTGR